MKQGKTVANLSAELRRITDVKHDYIAPVGHIRVLDTTTETPRLDLSGIGSFDIGDVAHGQIAQYIGIGKKYYDTLLGNRERWRTAPIVVNDTNELNALGVLATRSGLITAPEQAVRVSDITGFGPSLYDVTANTIIRAMPEGDKRLARTLDGKVRAFLSDSFSLDIDNFDVAQAAFGAMDRLGLTPEDIASCDVTEKYLYIKVASQRLQAKVLNDTVQFGFVVRTSEVGLAGLDISSFNMNLVCLNGMVGESIFKRRHVGKALDSDDDGTVFMSDTRQADAQARLLKMRDHITAAMDEHRVKQLAGAMETKGELKLDIRLDKVMEVTKKRFNLRDDEGEQVIGHLLGGRDLSLWGLSNAITRTAADRRSYDRASELEGTGFQLLMGSRESLEGIIA